MYLYLLVGWSCTLDDLCLVGFPVEDLQDEVFSSIDSGELSFTGVQLHDYGPLVRDFEQGRTIRMQILLYV